MANGQHGGPRENSGGAREGAGRKPKALRYAAELASAEQRIIDAAPKIIDALVKAAEGGDVAAARYLMDRLWGRVADQTKPIAEDISLPPTHPAAEVIAQNRRQHELAKELYAEGSMLEGRKTLQELEEASLREGGLALYFREQEKKRRKEEVIKRGKQAFAQGDFETLFKAEKILTSMGESFETLVLESVPRALALWASIKEAKAAQAEEEEAEEEPAPVVPLAQAAE